MKRIRVLLGILASLALVMGTFSAAYAGVTAGNSNDVSATSAAASQAQGDDESDHCEDSENKGHKDCKPENNPKPSEPPCDADHGHPGNRAPQCDDDNGTEGPPGDETCDDGIDNDGDGFTDGDDPDCQGGTEGPQGDETCTDGEDNDGDGLVDGDDPDCNEGANDGEFCADGEDNDGDGLTDGDDPDCPEPDPCTSEAGDPGILTEDTLGQTLWDSGADALSPLTEDPDGDGVITGEIYNGGNGTPLEPLTDEVACAGDLAVDQDAFPVDP